MIRLSRFLWWLVWLGLGFYLALTLWLGLAGLGYPYQLDYGEGIVLGFAQQIAHGQAIYKSLTVFPFASSNYPPVALLLSAALMPIFGEGYTSGRLLNLASMLIIAALIYRIVRAETQDRRAGTIAALFFLGSPYIYHWAPLDRVDLIGVAFAFGGVYCVWKFSRQSTVNSKQSNLFLIFCTFCFLLALYTKHTLIAAPAAAFFALWMRNRRQAIVFAIALGAIGSATFLALDYITAGGFYLGLIESNASIFLVDQLVAQLGTFATTFPILLLLALWGWIQRVRAKQVGILEWYGVTAVAMLVLAGRIGAWENYFFEALAVACVFLGLKISDSAIRNSKFSTSNFQLPTSNLQILLPMFLLLQLALMWRDHDPRIAANLMAENFSANQQLSQLLKRTTGVIISEDMGALATSGKTVPYYTFQYSMLARSGKWDQNWELNGLRDGVFPFVILENGTREDVDHYRRFTREFVSALDRYYTLAREIGKYQVYIPAPPLHLQTADFGGEIAMVGWIVGPLSLDPEHLPVTIVWRAQREMTRRYTAFVHLEKSTGEKIAQNDHEPRQGDYPTTRWAAGEIVREMYVLTVSNKSLTDDEILRVGWYDSETGDRLEVPGSADNTIVLATYEVK